VIVVPAIDLRSGRCVRLTNGDPARATVYENDPVEAARGFERDGAALLHVVDLDAALDEGSSRSAVAAICASVSIPVQVGGGLRSLPAIDEVLASGAARAVVGTRAAEDPSFLTAAVEEFGGQLVVALDVLTGQAMVRGWRQAGGALERLLPLLEAAGAGRFLVTSIAVDGTLAGPDLELYRQVLGLTDRPVLASGGVRTNRDLTALNSLGIEGAIVGKALYEGTLSLGQAVAALAGRGDRSR